MARDNDFDRDDTPRETTMTDLEEDRPVHQRSARNDPSMRDGNSSHGNPYETDTGDELDSDSDIGDTTAEAIDASEEEGVLEAVPADQDDQPPLLNTPAHVGSEPTAAVDEAIDDRGTVEAGRESAEGGDAFEATVGDNSPTVRPAEVEAETETQPAADARAGDAPLDGYKRLTIAQIMEKVATLPIHQVQVIADYERAHRGRKTLLTRLERHLRSGGKNGNAGSHGRGEASQADATEPE